jgi:hypothetical protein
MRRAINDLHSIVEQVIIKYEWNVLCLCLSRGKRDSNHVQHYDSGKSIRQMSGYSISLFSSLDNLSAFN